MVIITLFSLAISKARRVMLIRYPFAFLLACSFGLLLAAYLIGGSSSIETLVVEKSKISINAQGQRVHENSPFTGTMLSLHDSGTTATEDQFVEGRRHGHAKKWFQDGTLGYEAHYMLGTKEGYTRSWWSNGAKRSSFFFADGKSEGTGWNWYRSGAKFKKFNNVAGKPTGIQQAWRKNGKLFSNFEYKNGRIYGLRKANNCVGLEDEVISPKYYQTQAYSTL